METVEPRPINGAERAWIEHGLGFLKTGEYFGGGRWIDVATGQVRPRDEPIDPSYWLRQLERLTVVAECQCSEANCHTVGFERVSDGKALCLVTASTPDGRMLNILVDERSGELAELEVI